MTKFPVNSLFIYPVLQKAAPQINPASWTTKETSRPVSLKAATPVTSSWGSCTWLVSILPIEFTNEPPLTARRPLSRRDDAGLLFAVHLVVPLCLSLLRPPAYLCRVPFVNIYFYVLKEGWVLIVVIHIPACRNKVLRDYESCCFFVQEPPDQISESFLFWSKGQISVKLIGLQCYKILHYQQAYWKAYKDRGAIYLFRMLSSA